MVSELEKLIKKYLILEKKSEKLGKEYGLIENKQWKIQKALDKALLKQKKLPKTISLTVGQHKIWAPLTLGYTRIRKPKK